MMILAKPQNCESIGRSTAEVGLDYFGARYFSAAQGRFTSPDLPLIDQNPLDPQSWNLFGYGRNNPLINSDPTGRCSQGADGKMHDDADGKCADVTSVTVTDKASKVRDLAAEAQAEMARLQYESWRRMQEENKPKQDPPLTEIARQVAHDVATNQSVQLVSTVSDCAASQVPFVDDGNVPLGPTMVAAGQPWIPTRGKFGGATADTSVASIVLRKVLPLRIRLPGLTNAGVKATPTLGGFLGRAVPFVGWGWTAYSVGSCVAAGPR
jgi:RHS repeat-associated protein